MCDILLQMHFKNPTQTPKMAQLVSVPTRSTASSSRSTCWSSSAPSSSCCSSTTRRSRSGPDERRPRRGRPTQPQPRSSTAISRVGPKKKKLERLSKASDSFKIHKLPQTSDLCWPNSGCSSDATAFTSLQSLKCFLFSFFSYYLPNEGTCIQFFCEKSKAR